MTTSITCHAAELKRALAFAMQPVERRNFIPVLAMVKITGNADQVEVRGTDLDVECAATADVISATGEISMTIRPKFLADLLRWAEGEVTISRKKDLITISVDDIEATVRELCPVEDWPLMVRGSGASVEIGAAKLHKALGAVIGCISTEETRYYLNGVFLHNNDGLRAVATDGHRMAFYDAGETWPFEGMIVPRKTVAIIHRAIKAGSNGTVQIEATPDPKNSDATLAPKHPANRVTVKGDGWEVVSKTIDGTFPDYARVIPERSQNATATLTIDALRRFPSTGDGPRGVKVDTSAGRATWETYEGASVSMPIQATGNVSVGFDMKYLLGFARQFGTIRIETKDARSPAHILTDDPALVAVLMPMRI